ncbi:MAG: hypothetical protein GDA56_31780 [Hormoscilla sp. GM7CHS1pb]|nr:hypothetical protein [Hormoscilla sp. GM7CHS1pb]
MKILHGTWIPQGERDFIQTGGFYLWVETSDLPQKAVKDSQCPRRAFGVPRDRLMHYPGDTELALLRGHRPQIAIRDS